MGGVGRVLDDGRCSAYAEGEVEVLKTGERASNGLFSSSHHKLQGLAVPCRAVPKPSGDVAGEDTLHHASVEGGEGGW